MDRGQKNALPRSVNGEPVVLSEPELQRLLMERNQTVYRYVASRIPKKFRSVLQVEDVLQEVWASAFQSIAGFRPDGLGSFDRWLTAIAGRRLADMLRAVSTLKRGGQDCTLRDYGTQHRSFAGLFSQLVSPGKTPSREVSSREAVQAVRIALGGLSEPRRRAIYLRHIEGRPCHEIAREMQKSDAAVNGLLYQGLRELRERLGHARRFFSDAKSWPGR